VLARHGKSNLFVAVEPLPGWRNDRVTQHHTNIDFAEELRFLVDMVYPNAEPVSAGLLIDKRHVLAPT